MVVVAIIGVLSTMAGVGLMYGTGKVRLNNAVFEVGSLYSIAQMRAASTGRTHFVAVWYHPTSKRFGAVAFDEPPSQPAVVWTNVVVKDFGIDPENDAQLGGRVVEKVDLWKTGGIAFREIATQKAINYASGLPQPFKSISLTASGSGNPLAEACSFCIASSGGTLGVVQFDPSGRVSIPNGTGADSGLTGAALVLSPSTNNEEARNAKWLVIAAPAGLVKVL
jgi:type II secretory pathway pseudopilin PulG